MRGTRYPLGMTIPGAQTLEVHAESPPGFAAPEAAIGAVKVREAAELGLQGQRCVGVGFNATRVRYRFETMALEVWCARGEVRHRLIPPPEEPGEECAWRDTGPPRLRFDGVPPGSRPFAWAPDAYADQARGATLVRVTRSDRDITFVDFRTPAGPLSLYHTAVLVGPDRSELLLWYPDPG